MTERRRLLFIGGWGRSGSTILGRILGQAPGVFSAGEIREIWEAGCRRNRPCGCGEPFDRCPFWTEVGRAAFGGWETLDLDEILRLRYSVDRPWMVPAILARGRLPGSRDIDRYREILDALYFGIAKTSGAEVIVDSSSIPSAAYLTRDIGWLDLRVLHLVRDSRGVAYSWLKVVQKDRAGDDEYLPRYGVVASSIRWLLYNAETGLISRLGVPYDVLRYEDLLSDPRGRLDAVLRFAGAPHGATALPFVADDELQLASNHTVDGNPVRFSEGPTKLRLDDAWRTKLAARDRAVVGALTFPGLAWYGYIGGKESS